MKLSKKSIALTISPIIIICGVAYFAHWVNGPASTSVGTVSSGDVLSTQITLKEFGSAYFTTLVPDTMQLKTKEENHRATTVGNYLLKNSNVKASDQLAITIGQPGQESLETISHVTIRKMNPEEYKRTTVPNMPSGAIAFQKQNTYEKSVFWIKDGYYIAVVVSGTPLRSNILDQTLQAVLVNWQ